MIVAQALPEHRQRQCLPVMHGSLTWIVPQDSVHHNLFFSFVEPSVFAAEFGSGLSWGGWKVKVGNDANQTSKCSFQSEQPDQVSESVQDVSLGPGLTTASPRLSRLRQPWGYHALVKSVRHQNMSLSTMLTVEDTVCEESRNNRCCLMADPEEGKADGQLNAGVPVTQI